MNENIIISGDSNGNINFWNIETGELIKTLHFHNDRSILLILMELKLYQDLMMEQLKFGILKLVDV